MLENAIAQFSSHWLLYLSMPLTSGLVGYVTNVIAIKMMFHPLDFWGIKPPFLGWQGIIPRKAGKMAAIACDTLVPHLVSEKEVFERLDPDQVAAEIEQPILDMVEHLTREILSEYEPTLWESLPNAIRNMIIKRVQEDAPNVVKELMDQMKDNISDVFDLKDMVITTLIRDRELINKVFQEAGREEFIFIGRSGFYFGFLFGLLQMVGWMFYQADWQLPLFGLLVGYATNWVALRMIFQPQQPRKFGPFVVQGLFFKRQREISRDYGKLIADEIVTPINVIEAVLKGPYADQMFNMIARAVTRSIDEQAGVARRFVAWTVGSDSYVQMKHAAVERIVQQAPDLARSVNDYAREAMDIKNVLAGRLEVLPPEQFEGMLRPAFQEDEWMLIAVGAALGFCVGVGQVMIFTAVMAADKLNLGSFLPALGLV